MAEKKKQQTLSASEVREMQPKKRDELLVSKQSDLVDARRSLAARELTNPRKVAQLRREIAVIKTVKNEADNNPKEAK